MNGRITARDLAALYGSRTSRSAHSIHKVGGTLFDPPASVEGVDRIGNLRGRARADFGETPDTVVVSMTLGKDAGTMSHGIVSMTLDPDDILVVSGYPS